jgi:UDPglucose 6-dehydrogenase
VKINEYQKNRFTQKIIDRLGGRLEDKKIAILGWAFKPNTNDSRESPAIFVASKLLIAGAFLKIFDPMVNNSKIISDLQKVFFKKGLSEEEGNHILKRLEIFENLKDAIFEVDHISVITKWDDFKDVAPNKSL